MPVVLNSHITAMELFYFSLLISANFVDNP